MIVATRMMRNVLAIAIHFWRLNRIKIEPPRSPQLPYSWVADVGNVCRFSNLISVHRGGKGHRGKEPIT